MFQILKNNPLAAAIAIGMHLVIILLMIFGLDWWEKPEAKRFKANVVQATVIDAAKVDAEVKKLKLADENKKKKKINEAKKLDDLKKKRQLEEKRLADLKKKRKAEEAKKLKLEKERKLKEAEAKKRKAAEEQKRKKAAEEKKRKAAAEKKRKAEEAKKRKLAEQRKREAQLRAEMEAERDATELELYAARIQEAIEMEWLRPMGVGDGLSCTLRIRMAAGGSVIAAQVVRSSGSSAFDRSAEAAVRKADPLPVPSGRLFEKMRTIDLEFAPSGE
jgi:colicin import membrane protein